MNTVLSVFFYTTIKGPAQNIHGATYTVDVEFERENLEEKLNWVIDIGKIIERVYNKN